MNGVLFIEPWLSDVYCNERIYSITHMVQYVKTVVRFTLINIPVLQRAICNLERLVTFRFLPPCPISLLLLCFSSVFPSLCIFSQIKSLHKIFPAALLPVSNLSSKFPSLPRLLALIDFSSVLSRPPLGSPPRTLSYHRF